MTTLSSLSTMLAQPAQNTKVLMPLIRNVLPSLIAQQIVGVQPMSASAGAFSMDYEIPYAVHPRYKFSRKWHVGVAHMGASALEVYAWCSENFGTHPVNPDAWSRWYRYSYKKFYFRDEVDYVAFLLRWK